VRISFSGRNLVVEVFGKEGVEEYAGNAVVLSIVQGARQFGASDSAGLPSCFFEARFFNSGFF